MGWLHGGERVRQRGRGGVEERLHIPPHVARCRVQRAGRRDRAEVPVPDGHTEPVVTAGGTRLERWTKDRPGVVETERRADALDDEIRPDASGGPRESEPEQREPEVRVAETATLVTARSPQGVLQIGIRQTPVRVGM
jgi:hypothetical protein